MSAPRSKTYEAGGYSLFRGNRMDSQGRYPWMVADEEYIVVKGTDREAAIAGVEGLKGDLDEVIAKLKEMPDVPEVEGS